MGVYDTALIMSWTPREYMLRVQGAQLRDVDLTERAITSAVISGNVARSRDRVSVNKIYPAASIRKKILHLDDTATEKKKTFEHFDKAIQAVNSFKFNFTPK